MKAVLKYSRDEDQILWLDEMADYVKKLQLPELASTGLYEYLVEMGNSEKRELDSQIVRLLKHLLKFRFQPERQTPSWAETCDNAREEILISLRRNKSFKKRFMPKLLLDPELYALAKRGAEKETKVKMPLENPFTAQEIMDDDFYG
jgi:hypothetical protein